MNPRINDQPEICNRISRLLFSGPTRFYLPKVGALGDIDIKICRGCGGAVRIIAYIEGPADISESPANAGHTNSVNRPQAIWLLRSSYAFLGAS